MKSKITKIAALACIFSIFAILLDSCKKVDTNNSSDQSQLSSANVAAAKMEIGNYIREHGLEERVEVNQRLTPMWEDLNGNPVDIVAYRASHHNYVSNCGMNDPNYVDNTFYSFGIVCGQGYQISFGYNISWDNNVVTVNPNLISNVTKGQAKISITGNANAFVNTTTSAVITDLGVDPTLTSNHIFSVVFTCTSYVSPTIMNDPSAVLRLNAHFASDCSDLEDVQLTYAIPTGGFLPTTAGFPCSHNDRCFYQQHGIFASNKIGIYGFDPLQTCDDVSDYTESQRPSVQEVQYNIDNTGWTDFINTSCSNTYGIYGTRYVFQWDYALSGTLSSGTHAIQVRWRNWHYNSHQTTFPDPTTVSSCFCSTWTTYSTSETIP